MDESVVRHLEKPAISDTERCVLLRAADIIERDGHCKGALWEPLPLGLSSFPMLNNWASAHRPTCLVGAINRAHHGDSEHHYDGDVFRVVARLAGLVHGGSIESAVSWNNAPWTTAADVATALRAAAA